MTADRTFKTRTIPEFQINYTNWQNFSYNTKLPKMCIILFELRLCLH